MRHRLAYDLSMMLGLAKDLIRQYSSEGKGGISRSAGSTLHWFLPIETLTALIIFLKVISKVLFFNITQKFTNLLVQLSIFLIDLFVGTYRLSSHARLEAFVIQTKLLTALEEGMSV